ncbi:MAG TPA: PstS family phosphate ABC transporter substrate-binding protein [Micromonosporaceae bacterium]|nr:PstS family phosphate ABC transporter substrate-binding protein [Micromonosporaceae bacterium]
MNRNALSRPVAAGALLTALALATPAALAGCGGDGGTAGGLAGSVLVDGSSTVAPLSKAAADIYREEQPKVNITVGTSGTGGGFEKFCKGETDVSNASRQIKDSEKAACAAANITYTELVVANDALTVVVNKANTWSECLTTAQLKKVWDQGSKVRSWKEVDPSFPDQRLDLFGPGTDSGTFDFFTAAINGKEDRSRADYTASENDNVLVQGVAGSTGGLGYFGFTYFEENADKLKAVKVDGGGGCVAPSVAAAQDGSYRPLSRPLYIYVSNQAMASKPQVRSFVEFYAGHIDEIVEETRYVPLTAAQKADLGAALDKAKG